jgi:hypothetical protein
VAEPPVKVGGKVLLYEMRSKLVVEWLMMRQPVIMWFELLLSHTEHAEKTGVPAKLWGLQISL